MSCKTRHLEISTLEFVFALVVFAGMSGLALFWSAWLSLESPVRRPRLRLQGAALILAYVLLVAFEPWLAAHLPEPGPGPWMRRWPAGTCCSWWCWWSWSGRWWRNTCSAG